MILSHLNVTRRKGTDVALFSGSITAFHYAADAIHFMEGGVYAI